MTSALERHIALLEEDLAKVNETYGNVAEEQELLKAKLGAIAEQIKRLARLETDRKQLLKESQTCAERLLEIEAEQTVLQIQIDALKKAGG